MELDEGPPDHDKSTWGWGESTSKDMQLQHKYVWSISQTAPDTKSTLKVQRQ